MSDFNFESVASCCAAADDLDEENGPAQDWHISNAPNCEERTIINQQGLRLAVFEWPPLVPVVRGLVLLFHGIDSNTRFEFLRHRSILSNGEELGLQYERSTIQAFNDAGFVCVGADMQGYGTSQRVDAESMAYFERFEDIERDALLLFDDAKARRARGVRLAFLNPPSLERPRAGAPTCRSSSSGSPTAASSRRPSRGRSARSAATSGASSSSPRR